MKIKFLNTTHAYYNRCTSRSVTCVPHDTVYSIQRWSNYCRRKMNFTLEITPVRTILYCNYNFKNIFVFIVCLSIRTFVIFRVISVTSSSAGHFWTTINKVLSSFLYWFKTDRYATVRWKNGVVAEAAGRRYGTSDRRIKTKILSYYNELQVQRAYRDAFNSRSHPSLSRVIFTSYSHVVFMCFSTPAAVEDSGQPQL